jgi:hypothetical protein
MLVNNLLKCYSSSSSSSSEDEKPIKKPPTLLPAKKKSGLMLIKGALDLIDHQHLSDQSDEEVK